jgi:fructose-1-phosphate kinase PfkB-like protein
VILCVAGNPSVDRMIEVEALAAGEIHRPSSLVVLPGGKGLHVARVSAALASTRNSPPDGA